MTLFVCPRRRRGRPQNTNTPIFPQLFPIRHLCLYYSSLHKRRRRTSHITICSVNAALRACHALPSSSQPVHSRLHHNQCTLNWEKNVSPLISSARMCGSFPAVDCHAPAVAAVFFAVLGTWRGVCSMFTGLMGGKVGMPGGGRRRASWRQGGWRATNPVSHIMARF